MTDNQEIKLHEQTLSLRHDLLIEVLSNSKNLLIIQDLDGVCMKLVKNPLTRVMDINYIKATKELDGHFFVLTNGEHIGKRGINKIVEKAFQNIEIVKEKGLYLPGLAAGGVQWQNRYGHVSHPGVTEKELAFLATVPQKMQTKLEVFCQDHCHFLSSEEITKSIEAVVLDNMASPTVNLNVFYEKLKPYPHIYLALQQEMENLMNELLAEAEKQELKNSFFVHYAPNLGRNEQGLEIMRPATKQDSGTTDFQFMLKGAIKEAGVLFILNYYYFLRTGKYPLGEDFNVRQAPQNHQDLITLVKDNFDPKEMPLMVGVGDTVTSKVFEKNGKIEVKRGGSDRNFLQLVQDIGQEFNTGNIVVYIDSSQGEVKNRKPLKITRQIRTEGDLEYEELIVTEGPGDSQDLEDPLKLNVAFPEGHQQYYHFFQSLTKIISANNK